MPTPKKRKAVTDKCRNGCRGRSWYRVDPKKKVGWLACSWCGSGIGPRRHGAALWNLYRAGAVAFYKKIPSPALLLPAEATVPFFRRATRRTAR
jgi:hypothetical protein